MAENDTARGIASLESNARYVPEVWDRENPDSLVSLLTESLAKAAEAGREAEPELYDLDEHEIFTRLERKRKAPTPTLNRLRNQLWIAFEKAKADGKAIEVFDICVGICTPKVLNIAFRDPDKAAWLFTPPERYIDMLDETLQYGMKKLRAILDMNDVRANGSADIKLLELKFKIVAMMDLRKNGAPTQKIEQKSMNVNYTKAEKEITGASLEELEKRAAELRKQNLIAQNLPPAVVAQLSAPEPRADEPMEVDDGRQFQEPEAEGAFRDVQAGQGVRGGLESGVREPEVLGREEDDAR
jgi:hypothetical protein